MPSLILDKINSLILDKKLFFRNKLILQFCTKKFY